MTATEHALPPDHEARTRALAPGESFIVQAPAGSGKTELLTQRYLRLLATVSDPEEVVAITFTRKAAAEMQARILRALEQARTGPEPPDGFSRTTWRLAARALERDRERSWDLSDNPRRLRIHTIDSLCARLTRQMPVLSRLGAQPETVEDAMPLYRAAAEAVLAELEEGETWSEPIALLLAHLDNDLPRIRDLLAGMLARRDQWLAHVTNPDRGELESALARLVETALEAARGTIPEECRAELGALLARAGEGVDADSPVAALAGLPGLPGTGAADLPRWQAVATFLLTKQNQWRRRLEKNFGLAEAGDAGEGWKSRYLALLARLAEEDDLRRRLREVRSLPAARYSDGEWRVVEALCRLLRLADAQLTLLFAERNVIDFTGITRAAISALGEDEAPTDLALHLDYQVRHLLVDEFQDISSQQYLLLRRLTAGWAPGDGRTLFLVGDPMQSIYGFREAEVGLYLDTWNAGRLGDVPLTPLRITVNFRSSRAIVDWVNRVFARVLPARPDVARGAVSYAAAEPFHGEGESPAVLLHAVPSGDDAAEAQTVRRLVEEAMARRPGGSVAVLVRNRSALETVVPVLKAAGLRFRAVEIEPLGHRPAIQDLMALARALAQPADRVAWLAVLRAPWCGLGLSDLLAIAGQGDARTLWQRASDPDCRAALTPDGRHALERLVACLEPVLADRGRRRFRRWVESAWLRLGGPATLSDPTDLENVRAFFELLDDLDDGGELRDPQLLAARAAGLFAAPDTAAGEALQVMTIHKAKGLEFDTVIVTGLARSPGRDESVLLRWSHRARAGGGEDLLLAPIPAAGRPPSPVYETLGAFENERRDYEEGRLMYVAATRARERLHLVTQLRLRDDGTPAPPPAGSLLGRLWPALAAEFAAVLTGAVAEAPPGSSRPGLRRFPRDWALPEAPPPAPLRRDPLHAGPLPGDEVEFRWAGDTIQQVGILVHRLLGRLPGGVLPDDADIARLLAGQGVPRDEIPWAADSVRQALENTLSDPRGRWLLDPRHEALRREYPLSGLVDGRLVNVVLDRTFVDAQGVRWIVDYKTSRHEGPDLEHFLDRELERYRGQLERYATLMRRLDARPIRLGLYFPLLRGWREWAFGG